MKDGTALALARDLRAYAEREQTHNGLVLAHGETLRLAADEIEKAASADLPSDGQNQRSGTALESPRPELRASAAEAIGREGMVTVWDDQGRYLGCMGVELWKHLLTVRDA
jgi:hypothetical protein